MLFYNEYWPTRLSIYFTFVNFFFSIEQMYLRNYWTDYHDFFHQIEGICANVVDPDHFFRFLKGRGIATNFEQNWQNDLHLAPWHFKTHWNITIWMSGFIVPIIPIHSVEIWWTQSNNAGDHVVTNLYFCDDMAKIGIFHRISQQLLNQSVPNFQHC